MLYLKNIYINDLDNEVIIDICNQLGCKIDFPKKEINKYTKNGLINLNSIYELWRDEEKKLNQKYKKKYDKYIENLKDWLKNNGYLEEV